MSSEWPRSSLTSLCLQIADCPHSTPVWMDKGVVVLRNQNIKNGKLDLSSPSFTDEENYQKRVKRAAPEAGDIVITREAPMGDVCQIPKGLRCCLGQRQVLLKPNPDKVDSRYLLFVLQSSSVQRQIGWNEGTGSTVSNLRIPVLESLQIEVPPLNIQNEIAQILGALDDRIALLRETNITLESIAQALFKSWFVDFDPVHANAGTHAPSLPPEIQNLFPSTFVESSLGLVPEGWKRGCLADVLSLRNEKIKAGNETARFPYVPIESITAKSPFLNESKSGLEANSSLTLFKKGDILFGAMRPYFHKVCLAPFDGVTRTTVFTLYPKNKASTAFGLFTTYQESTIAFATQHSEGSTIPYAKWKNSLELMTTIVPSLEVQQAFNEIVMPLIESANAHIEKTKVLASLRDTLLPRLISGQLRLPEVEEILQ